MLRLVLKALAESVGSAYGSAVLAYALAFGLMVFAGDHRWIDAILTSPTFFLPMAAGSLFAYALRNHLSRVSYFAWIVPGAVLVRAFLEVARSPYASNSETWNTLFGTKCGASECLYQALFTLPFVCGLSYSISSACVRASRRNSVPARENTAK